MFGCISIHIDGRNNFSSKGWHVRNTSALRKWFFLSWGNAFWHNLLCASSFCPVRQYCLVSRELATAAVNCLQGCRNSLRFFRCSYNIRHWSVGPAVACWGPQIIWLPMPMIPKSPRLRSRPIYYWAGIYPSFLVNLRIGANRIIGWG
jgi:hypothetical protein